MDCLGVVTRVPAQARIRKTLKVAGKSKVRPAPTRLSGAIPSHLGGHERPHPKYGTRQIFQHVPMFSFTPILGRESHYSQGLRIVIRELTRQPPKEDEWPSLLTRKCQDRRYAKVSLSELYRSSTYEVFHRGVICARTPTRQQLYVFWQ